MSVWAPTCAECHILSHAWAPTHGAVPSVPRVGIHLRGVARPVPVWAPSTREGGTFRPVWASTHESGTFGPVCGRPRVQGFLLKGLVTLSGKRFTLSGNEEFSQKSQPNVMSME